MTNYDGYSSKELREREEESRDKAQMKSYCAFCPGVEFTGTAIQVRKMALDHRLEEHPEIKWKNRHTRHLGSFRQRQMDQEQLETIDSERRRRAYLIGIEIEDGERKRADQPEMA